MARVYTVREIALVNDWGQDVPLASSEQLVLAAAVLYRFSQPDDELGKDQFFRILAAHFKFNSESYVRVNSMFLKRLFPDMLRRQGPGRLYELAATTDFSQPGFRPEFRLLTPFPRPSSKEICNRKMLLAVREELNDIHYPPDRDVRCMLDRINSDLEANNDFSSKNGERELVPIQARLDELVDRYPRVRDSWGGLVAQGRILSQRLWFWLDSGNFGEDQMDLTHDTAALHFLEASQVTRDAARHNEARQRKNTAHYAHAVYRRQYGKPVTLQELQNFAKEARQLGMDDAWVDWHAEIAHHLLADGETASALGLFQAVLAHRTRVDEQAIAMFNVALALMHAGKFKLSAKIGHVSDTVQTNFPQDRRSVKDLEEYANWRNRVTRELKGRWQVTSRTLSFAKALQLCERLRPHCPRCTRLELEFGD